MTSIQNFLSIQKNHTSEEYVMVRAYANAHPGEIHQAYSLKKRDIQKWWNSSTHAKRVEGAPSAGTDPGGDAAPSAATKPGGGAARVRDPTAALAKLNQNRANATAHLFGRVVDTNVENQTVAPEVAITSEHRQVGASAVATKVESRTVAPVAITPAHQPVVETRATFKISDYDRDASSELSEFDPRLHMQKTRALPWKALSATAAIGALGSGALIISALI